MTIGRMCDRFLKKLAVIPDLFSRVITTTKTPTQNFGSQRVCPFCNLITPRSGRFCLECGRSFGNA
jgi:hypothetical protein